MSDRERSLGEVLAGVVALSRSVAAERRTPFDGVELTPNQLALLFLLARSRSAVTPGACASALGVTAGAITQLVDGLRAAGLIESVQNPDDRRSRLLRLTDAARESVRDYESGVVRRLLPQFAGLNDVELETLAELLGRIQGDGIEGGASRTD